jgi:pimeloyl-ACP methyl ester carboxylesterase
MKKFISVMGFQYCVQDNGRNDQPLVFIHGLPTSKELFIRLSPLFEQDYRTICIDLLDYGESEKSGRHLEHSERAMNLCRLFTELELNEIILVCHDLGASVGMELMANCREKISRLVLMSPPVYPDFTEPGVVKIVRAPIIGPALILLAKNRMLKRSVEKGLFHKESYRRYLQGCLEKSYSGWKGSRALLRNLRWGRPERVFARYPEIMKSINQPVLIIQGMMDPYIPVSHAERLLDDIPDARLSLLENAGHFLPLDVPEEIHEVIRKFLLDIA